MSPFVIASVIVGTVSLTIGLLYLLVASRLRDSRAHLSFSLTALAASANAYIEPWAYGATTPGAYSIAFKWQIAIQIVWWICLVWFLWRYTGMVRRWLAGFVALGFSVAGLLHLLSPHGILFVEIRELVWIELPWGERIALASGFANPWRLLGDLSTLGMCLLVVDTCFRLWRHGAHRRALSLGASLALLLAALIHGILVDLLMVRSPYLLSFAFVGLILITGSDLATEAVRAVRLTRELYAKEERWQDLLESIPLLVVRADPQGRMDYVNPYFLKTVGYSLEQILGHPLEEWIHAEEQDPHEDPVAGATVVDLATREGEKRHVRWSSVTLRDADERPIGTLSIGTDLTGRILAERARDQAVRQLEDVNRKFRLRPPSDWDRRQAFRVLVVDDDAISRLVAVSYLEVLGFRGEAAEDGVHALALLADGPPVDAILLDCQMPRLDGYETARRIRRKEAVTGSGGRRIVLVALTAHGGVQQQCLDAGMDDYLVKPFNGDQVAATLDRWLVETGAVEESIPATSSGPAHLEALKRLGEKSGDDVLGQVIDSFLEEGPRLAAEIRDALARGALDSVARSAHLLKGSARVLHALRLKDLCSELERLAREGAARACVEQFEAVEKERLRFTEELRIQAPSESRTSASVITPSRKA